MLSAFFKKVHTLFSGCNILHFAKRKAIVGLVLGIAALYICAHFYGSLRLGAIFALGFVLIGAVKFDYKKRSRERERETILHIVWSLVCLFIICYISLEFLDTRIADNLEFRYILLNFLCALIIYLLSLSITGRASLALIISAVVLLSMSTINGFVFLFRGKEFCAADILSVRTAANVASQYTYYLPPHISIRYIISILLVFSMFSLPPSRTVTFKGRLAYLAATLLSSFLLVFASRDIGVKTWEYQGSQFNGFYLNFYLGLRDSFDEKPDGYSPSMVDKLSKEYENSSVPTDCPNIVVIMNEAFSDISVFSNPIIPVEEYMPFISSLEENTIKGHALASVFAGSTANSEYEFLFGHTLSFFPNPTSAVPYQQYISSELACLPWTMKHLGYDTFATHPYLSSGWSRDVVYPMFGFERSAFVDEYQGKELVRGYISDKGMYSYLLDSLYSRDSSSPLFLFGISMQNHSSYDYSGENYEKTVEIAEAPGKFPLTEQYLSLIRKSDEAVEYLLTELEKFPEDTIVLFFGDHMPKIEDEFYALLNGGTPDTLGEQMLKYTVPFFIWANYDIEEYTLEQTSLNYLAGHLLDAAGIELPPYYQFLRDTENIIPAINAFGYYSKAQERMIPLDEAEGEEAEAIKKYRYVQYNNMFDEENRNELFFGQYIPAQ